MSERSRTSEDRLANERALYRYQRALERGDIDTLAALLQEASANQELEEMICTMHEQHQPAEQRPARAGESHPLPREPVFPSYPMQATRHRRERQRFQMLAALLLVAALIAGSVLLFPLHRLLSTSGTQLGPPAPTRSGAPTTAIAPTKTVAPTQTVDASLGLIVLLFTSGQVQAVRERTGQPVWSYATGQNGLGDSTTDSYRGLIVHDRTVYVMARRLIVVLNEQSGRLLWQHRLPASFASVMPDESQELLDGGILYASLESEPRSVAYALRASDGQILWQVSSTDVNPPLLAVSNGVAYVAVQNAATTQTSVQARRGSDGQILWTFALPGVVSFATVANQVLYLYAFPGAVPYSCCSKADKRLLAVQTKTGTLLWSHDVSYGNYTANILYAQGVLIVIDGYTHICVHSASNGALLWCVPNPAFDGSTGQSIVGYTAGPDSLYVAIATQPGFAFIPADRSAPCRLLSRCPDVLLEYRLWQVPQSLRIMALDLQHGQTRWQGTFDFADSSSFLSLSLVPASQATLLVGTNSPLLTALDPGTGRMLWQVVGTTSSSSVLQIAGI